MGRRILMSSMDGVEFSGDAASIFDMMFGFYEVSDGSPESCSTGSMVGGYEDDDPDEDGQGEGGADLANDAENKAFWEAQHEHLKGTLGRTSSLEIRIRKATKDALRAAKLAETICICQRPVTGGCRNCLMRIVSDCLCNAGYNSAVCKSKWKSSPDISSGEHTYIDVVDNSNPKKGEVRVVIELNFRVEFKMARAGQEYNQLVDRLPEIFVGKADRLRSLIKIICSAAKRCMKERKMHMGPWRKLKYMQAKWFSPCKRTASTLRLLPEGLSSRQPRPKASMLTFDLLEKMQSLHCTAVTVL